jgi:NAD(P)H-dependent FMN reductase
MRNIVIISSSVRLARNSHRVALYFKRYLSEHKIANADIVDLNEYKFPLFDERLRSLPNPSQQVLEFADKIKNAGGIIIVTPEYNGGYPASLKNVIDLLYAEWKRKPIAIATVSSGAFGGSQVITSLVFTLWKIGAWVVPSMFPVPKVQEAYDPEGAPTDKEVTDKRAKTFVDELVWCMQASEKMKG